MKKKFLVLAAAGLASIGTQFALADCCPMDNWYTELSVGASWHNNGLLGDGGKITEDPGYEINFSFGFKTDFCWRLAVQAHYERYENDDYTTVQGISIGDNGHLSTFALLFNLLYDIPINDCLVWYLGAGIGVGMHRLELNNNFTQRAADSCTKFAWQLMSGFVYDFDPSWALTLNYSWINLIRPNAPTRSITASKRLRRAPFSNNIDIGLRFKF